MQELTKHFPKEVAIPYRIACATKEEFFRTVDRHNCREKKIYFSLYDLNLNISCIAFDLDSNDAINNIIKLHEYCRQKDLKHLMIFSTGGFWFYIFTKNYEKLKNKKEALANAQEYIAKKIGLSIYKRNSAGMIDPKINDLDFHIIGDIKRVARMPNTYDKCRGIYSIPLRISDVRKGFKFVKEKAKKQQHDYVYYNNAYFDISKYDKPREENIVHVDTKTYDVKIGNIDGIVKLFPKYIKRWLVNKDNDTWEARFYFAVFCRDFGLDKKACDKLAYKYFGKNRRTDHYRNNYNHFKRTKVLDYAFNPRIIFPNAQTLKLKGLLHNGEEGDIYE